MKKNRNGEDYSLDTFLGGQISLFQPLKGYRANTDSILLAAAVNAKKDQNVLELGCGVGAVICALMRRVSGLNVTGIELQKKYAQLAMRNALHNNFKVKVLDCDITALPTEHKSVKYDHVVLNPPFFRLASSMRFKRLEENIAKREFSLDLKDWLDIAIKRCSSKGEVVLIQRADRLAEVIKSMNTRLGDIKILPISSFDDQNATRIIVRGKKGSKSPLQILPPLILHEHSKTHKLNTKYTEKVEGILKMGQSLVF